MPACTLPPRRRRPPSLCSLHARSCGLACLAQFYPKKYPDNFWVLVGCVSGYVVLSLLMSGRWRSLQLTGMLGALKWEVGQRWCPASPASKPAWLGVCLLSTAAQPSS